MICCFFAQLKFQNVQGDGGHKIDNSVIKIEFRAQDVMALIDSIKYSVAMNVQLLGC